ncbi:MAG: hypothetical protein IJ001_02065 [Oscillospiraceae bacterium]|nr:hypothetical protein [Oscillospiraceae bacterium]
MKKVLAILFIAVSLLTFASCEKNENYQIDFTIPAGNTDTFVFSEQDFSPVKNTITLSSDTEVVLKLSKVRGENTYELTTTLTPETPFILNVEKGASFKIGVYLLSPSDADTAVNIEIEGVTRYIE